MQNKTLPLLTAEQRVDLTGNPDYLLFDIKHPGQLVYACIQKTTYLESPFLDERITPRPTELITTPTDQLAPLLDQKPPPDIVIAHTSFCCSTLLSKLLIRNGSFVMSEPRVLTQLSNQWRQQNHDDNTRAGRLDTVVKLLGKKYPEFHSWGLKLSNFSNNLLDTLIALYPNTLLLLMWGDIDDFLISMLKHQQEAEKILPIYMQAFAIDYAEVLKRLDISAGLSLLQMAGLVWWLQINQFSELVKQHNIQTFKGTDLLADPILVLRSLSAQLPMKNIEAQAVVDTIKKPVKKTTDLSGKALKTERESIAETYASEIEKVKSWLEDNQLSIDTSIIESASIIQ